MLLRWLLVMWRRPGQDLIRDKRVVEAHSSLDMVAVSVVSRWGSEVNGDMMMDMSRPDLRPGVSILLFI